jgi:hypothetical protein
MLQDIIILYRGILNMMSYMVTYHTTNEEGTEEERIFTFSSGNFLDFFMIINSECARKGIKSVQDVVSIEEIGEKREKLDRNSIIDQAKSLINGERETTYGDPLVAHGHIAKGWSAILGVEKIPPSTVALMMAWLKISRILSNKKHEDSYADAIGYVALSMECAEKEDGYGYEEKAFSVQEKASSESGESEEQGGADINEESE